MNNLIKALATTCWLPIVLLATPAHANEALADALNGYLEFVEYSGGTIQPQQIPKEDLSKFFVIDARDAGQFAKGHMPGAINMEWRQVVSKRNEIPTDKPVLIYCNTGSLSAQAGFALRVLGRENVLILQDGFEGCQASQVKPVR